MPAKPKPAKVVAAPPPPPSDVKRKHPWLRIALGLLLLVVLGIAGYQLVLYVLARRHLRAAEQAEQRRDFPQASAELADYLSLKPNDADVRLRAARTARRGGDFAAALRELDEYRQRKGYDPPLELEIQLLRWQRGELAGAAPLVAQYLDGPATPDTPLVLEAYLIGSLKVFAPPAELGRTFVTAPPPESPRMLQAANQWLRLRDGQADQVEGLVWRGRVFALEGNYPKGVADFRQALELDPDHYEARKFLAFAVAEAAPEEMVAHLLILHQRRPDDKHVTFALANTYHSLGRLREARQVLEEAPDAGPHQFAFLTARGLVALDEGHIAEAEDLLRQALARAPDEPSVHQALARCLQSAGKTAEADEHQRKVVRLQAERDRKKE